MKERGKPGPKKVYEEVLIIAMTKEQKAYLQSKANVYTDGNVSAYIRKLINSDKELGNEYRETIR